MVQQPCCQRGGGEGVLLLLQQPRPALGCDCGDPCHNLISKQPTHATCGPAQQQDQYLDQLPAVGWSGQ
jgi:hypothetical protein